MNVTPLYNNLTYFLDGLSRFKTQRIKIVPVLLRFQRLDEAPCMVNTICLIIEISVSRYPITVCSFILDIKDYLCR